MNPEMQPLWRRAVACAGWRWLPGMLAIPRSVGPAASAGLIPTAYRLVVVGHHPIDPRSGVIGIDVVRRQELCGREWLPDLKDPATAGALGALVVDVWGDVGAYTVTLPCGGSQTRSLRSTLKLRRGNVVPTVEQWVAALEIAPDLSTGDTYIKRSTGKQAVRGEGES